MAIKARDVAEDFFTTYDGSVTTDEQLHAAIAAAKEKAMQAAIQMGGSDAVATKHGGQRKKKRSSSLGGGVSTIMKRRRSSRDAPSSSEGPLGHIPGVSVTHYGTWVSETYDFVVAVVLSVGTLAKRVSFCSCCLGKCTFSASTIVFPG